MDLIQEPDGRFRAAPGGAPANVAIALARLDENARIFARIGSDAFGTQLAANLRRNGVLLDHVVAAPERSSLAVAQMREDGSADYEFYLENTADWQWQPSELSALAAGARAIHFGSLAATINPGADVIADRIGQIYRADEVIISLDLNIRPSLGFSVERERARVEHLVAHAHVVKASVSDLAWLFPTTPPAEVCARWATRRVVILTRGPEGAVLFRENARPISVPARPVHVVDTVAAGDTFVAALLHRILSGAGRSPAAMLRRGLTEWREDLRFATTAASLACEWAGANPPMLGEVRRALES